MKRRLHDQKAGVAILAVLVILAILETVLRGVFLRKAMRDLPDAGEPIITMLYALVLIFFARKGKDRLFYLGTGGFLAYFVLKQLFGFPALVAEYIYFQANDIGILLGDIGLLFRMACILCTIAIGVLVIKYMNDGTVNNKAFNMLCVSATVFQLVHVVLGIPLIASDASVILVILNGLSTMLMITLFTVFTYDTAKKQRQKANLN